MWPKGCETKPCYIAPWGAPPTPVLPSVLRQMLASSPLSLTNSMDIQTVGDLEKFWDERTTPLVQEERDALISLVRQNISQPAFLSSLRQRIRKEVIFQSPLSARINKRVLDARAQRRSRDDPRIVMSLYARDITAEDLLRLPDSGTGCLLETLCTWEAWDIWKTLNENEFNLLKQLPCSSICGYALSPKTRSQLLKLRDGISFNELYRHFVIGVCERRLDHITSNEREQKNITQACLSFHSDMQKCKPYMRAKSGKLAWIIPSSFFESNTCTFTDNPQLANILQSYISPDEFDECREWLPWLSLGIVNLLRRWQIKRINAVRRAIFKLSKSIDEKTEAFYPWEHNFDFQMRHIPIQALYQHEPNKLVEDTLNALSNLGLTSINHLRCLHPNAVLLSKHPDKPLFALYNELNC